MSALKSISSLTFRRVNKCRPVFRLNLTNTIRSKYSNAANEMYQAAYTRASENPTDFWAEAASEIIWFKSYRRVMDSSVHPYTKWFPGGELNTCYNALDRHVEAGRGDQIALIYDSPVTKTVKKFTYQHLLQQVSSLAAKLVSMGVQKGDRVLIYMPMIPEAVVSMLACARIGAPHSVVFGGFAANQLATRIRHTQPKVIISANCGIEPNRVVWYKPILDEAINQCNLPENFACLIYNRDNFEPAKLVPNRDFDWAEALAEPWSVRGHDCVPVPSDHPLYILYTSGTTGNPKGIVRSTGGHTVVLQWSLKWIFGISNPGECWWAASDLGWVVGHSYICYGPLLSSLTTVLYEGKPVGTPDAAQFYRVINEHKVNGMFCAPTALRAIRKEDPKSLQAKKYSLKSLRNIFVAGEHCDSETRTWAQTSFQVPVLDNWWQTESGHPIAATCVGLGNNTNPPLHSCGLPLPGYQLKILKENGMSAERKELGRIVCKLPMPPGFMENLYNADDLYISSYFERFPGYYDSMDAGFVDDNGYLFVMSREDDVINIAGHRISTSSLEEVILEHSDISEAAVVGVPHCLKGQVPLAIYVIKPGCKKPADEITKELISLVRKKIGPVAAFKIAVAVPALPRTRSGKTPRKSLADLAQAKTIQIPPTIEDPSVYEPIIEAMKKVGFALNAKATM